MKYLCDLKKNHILFALEFVFILIFNLIHYMLIKGNFDHQITKKLCDVWVKLCFALVHAARNVIVALCCWQIYLCLRETMICLFIFKYLSQSSKFVNDLISCNE